MTAHSPAEWAAAGFLGLSVLGLLGLVLAFADADVDPRPWLRRVLESGRFDRLLIVVGPVLHDTRQTTRLLLRDAAVTVAALLTLLLPVAAPEATR